MCYPITLLFGCAIDPKKISTPSSYPYPPKKTLCAFCGSIGKPEYYINRHIFHICFIPCCACSKSKPYLRCSHCESPILYSELFKCRSCGVTTTFKSKKCPRCGNSKIDGFIDQYRKI